MIFTVLLFLLLLSILVLVHEFGHFISALLSGAKVEEFALGLPFSRSLISRKIKLNLPTGKSDLKISLYPLLFGGFVKIFGEENNEKEKYAFGNLSKLKRAFIIVSGVVMNFLLAWIVVSFLLTQGVPKPNGVYVTEVSIDSPAYTAGIVNGNKITAVNKRQIDYLEEIINATQDKLGQQITITLDNNKVINIIPRKNPPAGQGPLGVGLKQEWKEVSYPWYQAPFLGFKETLLTGQKMLQGLGDVLRTPKEIAGPLGIASLTGEAARYGYKAVLDLLAILSLNLAIINILPFPALDGGRLVFILLEPIMGKKKREKWEKRINSLGMALLLGLMFLITLNDVSKIIPR